MVVQIGVAGCKQQALNLFKWILADLCEPEWSVWVFGSKERAKRERLCHLSAG